MVKNGTSPAGNVGISAGGIIEAEAERGPTGLESREIAGGVGFPHAPEDREQFPRQGMSGVGGVYGMGHHPFVMSFEGVLSAAQGGVHGAEDDVFEDAVSSLGQSQSRGSGPSFFVDAAGLSFEADAAVFPEFAFGFEAPGGVEIGQQGQGANGADAGQLFPLPEDRFVSSEFSEMFSCQGDLDAGGVEADPEQLQLRGEGRGVLGFEPGAPAVEGMDDGGGKVQTQGAGAGAKAAEVLGVVLDVTMVQVDPLFQFDTPVVVAVMDGPEKTAAEERGELGGVDGVVFVAVGGDEVVSPRIADDELIDVGPEVSAEPAGQGAFLEGEVLDALEGVENLTDGGDGGGDGVAGLNAAMGLNGNFGGVAMHVGSDIIGGHDGSFRMGSFCIEPLYPRMPSLHIFTDERRFTDNRDSSL
jgi:hypothetical protein